VLQKNALDAILEGLPVYMMGGIVLVIVISQFNRVLGAILSVIFWVAVAVVGNYGYDQGHSIGLPDMPFPRAVFLLICLMFGSFHAAAGYTAFKRKQIAAEKKKILDED
jgi:hypothetical protein